MKFEAHLEAHPACHPGTAWHLRAAARITDGRALLAVFAGIIVQSLGHQRTNISGSVGRAWRVAVVRKSVVGSDGTAAVFAVNALNIFAAIFSFPHFAVMQPIRLSSVTEFITSLMMLPPPVYARGKQASMSHISFCSKTSST